MTNRRLSFEVAQSRLVESLFWYIYILFFIACSFITHRIDDQYWLYFSSAFFAYTGVLAAFIFIGGRYNRHALQQAKWVIFCILGFIVLLLLQATIPMEYRFASKPWASDAPNWFAPDTVISVVPEKTAWLILSNILVFCGFLVSLMLIDSRSRVKQLLFGVILAGSIHAIVGIYAYFTEIHLVDVKQLDGHFRTARGWFVNRNHFAALLSLSLVGSLTYLIKAALMSAKRKRKKPSFDVIIYAVLFCLCVMAIILSQSRAGLACLVLALLVVIIIVRRIGVGLSINGKLIIGIVLAIACFSAYYGQTLLSRFATELLSLGERGTQWEITWQAIKQAPIVGYGGGSYGTVFQVYRENVDLRDVIYNQSHSEYLHIWLEQGVVGLVLWLLILWFTFKQAIRIIKRSKSTLISATAIASATVLTAALMQAAVDFNLQILNIRWYFFVIIALLFSLSGISQSQARRPGKGNRKSSEIDQ